MHQKCKTFEDFGLIQYVSDITYRSGGILDQASNKFHYNVKSNSFISSTEYLFICFSLSNVKQSKSQHQLMCRNWTMFDSECFIKLLKAFLKIDFASIIDEAWDRYIRFEENISDFVLSFRAKTFNKHQCPLVQNELLSLN